jgi:hypothetical protein
MAMAATLASVATPAPTPLVEGLRQELDQDHEDHGARGEAEAVGERRGEGLHEEEGRDGHEGWGREEKMLHAAHFQIGTPWGRSTAVMATPSGMLWMAMAMVMRAARVMPPPKETPTAMPSEKECTVMTTSMSIIFRALSPRTASKTISSSSRSSEEPLGGEDEEDAQERAEQRLDPAVCGPLAHQPEAGAEHEAGGAGIGVGDGAVGEGPDEEEGERARGRWPGR